MVVLRACVQKHEGTREERSGSGGEGEEEAAAPTCGSRLQGGDLSWVTSAGGAAGDHSLLQAMQHSHSHGHTRRCELGCSKAVCPTQTAPGKKRNITGKCT